jgi:hypothetical protein
MLSSQTGLALFHECFAVFFLIIAAREEDGK